jgi:adenylate kinase family enzyme
MIELERTDRIMLLGESKSGKTYLAKKIIRAFPRHFVISPYVGEYNDTTNNVKYTLNATEVERIVEKILEQRNIMLVIDDADLFLENRINSDVYMLLFAGSRHRGVGYILLSRRTTDMPKLAFKQSNKVGIFQTDLALDLKIIADTYGDEAAQIVRSLNRQKHEFLWIDRENRTKEILVA